MRRRGTALLAAAALLVTGCGSSATEADDEPSERPTVAPSASIDPADLKPGNQPATPEALAAITLQHVRVVPEAFDGGDLYFEQDEVGTVLRWGADHSLEVKAGPVDDDLLSTWCHDGMSGCVEMTGATGTATVAWDLATDDGTPGQLMVSHKAGGEERRAAYVGEKITEDPRELDLEVSVDALVALVTDPRLGTRTTVKMTKAQVDGFPSEGANGVGEVALTAGAIAAGLLETKAYADIDSFEKADVSTYGQGAFGVVGTRPDGSTVTAVHAPNLPAGLRKCPKSLTCSRATPTATTAGPTGLPRPCAATRPRGRATPSARSYASRHLPRSRGTTSTRFSRVSRQAWRLCGRRFRPTPRAGVSRCSDRRQRPAIR
ncbi:hypothetical protein ACFVDI_22555 [Nocardioides sp. NPDC057767]|uniref:hypothetical protein n=1 Tax=unclassified Nocardioides TaxID=2615069 RepID=UPI00366BE570